MKLSIVTTLYQSAAHVPEFHARASAAAREFAGDDYEIVFVNDGSPDNSLQAAAALTADDPHVVVVDLSRNFGQHRAMMAAIAHARGDLVFLLDSDLEEEPEWLGEFAAHLTNSGCDVVYGVQGQRRGQWFDRLSGHVFYGLFKLLSGFSFPSNIVTARLMTRRYAEALARHTESEVFILGLWIITGFAQEPHPVEKLETSPSSYTLRKKLSHLVNSVTSFSTAPLVGIFYLGVVITTLSLSYVAYLVIVWLVSQRPTPGWTSVMASIWLLGGLLIAFMGVVGIYLSKIFVETKDRPTTIVKEIYGRPQE